MRQPVQNLIHRRQFLPGRQVGTVDHQHRYAERPRSIQLGPCARAARVFGHHKVGAMALYQSKVILIGERAARDDNFGVRQRQNARFVDQSQQIVMLRVGRKFRHVHPTHGQKDALSPTGQRGDCRLDIWNLLPAIPLLRFPGRASQRNKGNMRAFAGGNRIPAHLRGKGVRCVDHVGNCVVPYVFAQPIDPSESPHAHRQRLSARRVHAPGIRVDCGNTPVGKAAGQRIGFGRAAKKQEVGHE